MISKTKSALLVVISLVLLLPIAHAADSTFSPERYNVIWNSPGKDQNGSMPLGNGSTGINAWIEPNGDLIFYISRTDSWGGDGTLLKIGRVRIRLNPAPSTDDFLQTLSLVDGTLEARCGETDIRLWVDANHPVIHAEINGSESSTATASVELWRKAEDADTVLENQTDHLAWYHRNLYSKKPKQLAETQGLSTFKRIDPLLHRTFGALIKAKGAKRVDRTHLRSPRSNKHRFDLYVVAQHPATENQWLAKMDQTISKVEAIEFEVRRFAHEAWWKSFWQRSWIHATKSSKNELSQNLIPPNKLNFSFGVDSNGNSRFKGKMGRSSLLKVALDEDLIHKLAQDQESLSGIDPKELLFSATPNLHTELPNSDQWTNSPALTIETWIRPDAHAGSVRILNKILVGSNEGFLLDTHPGNSLRLIVGKKILMVKDCLTPNEWNHIAVVIDSQTGRIALYHNGRKIAEENPKRSLTDAYIVSRAYALQRYINACAARGAYPIKFNGSIFTVGHPTNPRADSGNPDYRQWGPGYWWQNTRMPYMSMCTSGDFEMTDSLYNMYCKELLEYHKHRTLKHTGHKGLYVPETMHFYGNHRVSDYGSRPFHERTDKLQESPWHKWEWVSGLELSYMMLDRYKHTLDEKFLQETIIPFAHEVLTFFDLQYKTGADGKLIMHPSQALETWWECTNPMPEVAGLHAVTEELLALPEKLTSLKQRTYWTQLKRQLPPIPTRMLNGVKMFAPAASFANYRNSEVPELYCVYPFRLSSFENPNAQLAIEALTHRRPKGYQGWRQDDIFMTYLGLTAQAQEFLVNRASVKHDGSRFPAFWGPNMDWIPDQTHGGVLLKAFQSMILQTEGKKVFISPAWPKDWNAEFKLHAPYKTTIQGRVENGKLVELKVSPKSRMKDVVMAADLKKP
ncbi:DUF5703 domain-containing protein [Lentisphaera marina]|uniref:DUF5703 domain-containing protein n=1 Tax=Lentisphaera marina TaxID=1111041 RepID=UPI0023657578|nr:DUF5703 domain-containing protein [Lentisphaera marina]MDD7983996.1 DUF5703 domain-containing protein [Lentisphaera marina]